MRIAVCDDEAIFRDEMKRYLEVYYKGLDTVIEYFSSGEELLDYYRKGKVSFQVILLDIEMKKVDGMQVARTLKAQNEEIVIIFMTSHKELALEGYEVSAFRFLTKPIKEGKLIAAIEAAKRQRQQQPVIMVHEGDRKVLLKTSCVTYIEAANKEVVIHTDNTYYKERMNIGDLESQLGNGEFFRTHRSYLVNLAHVKGHNRNTIYLENGEEVYLSRSKEKKFHEALLIYIKKHAW